MVTLQKLVCRQCGKVFEREWKTGGVPSCCSETCSKTWRRYYPVRRVGQSFSSPAGRLEWEQSIDVVPNHPERALLAMLRQYDKYAEAARAARLEWYLEHSPASMWMIPIPPQQAPSVMCRRCGKEVQQRPRGRLFLYCSLECKKAKQRDYFARWYAKNAGRLAIKRAKQKAETRS